jgi:hypothetical protein
MVTRTFSNFMHSATIDEISYDIPPDMLRRLRAASIKSRDGLLKWMRDRYPHEYKSYKREYAEKIWANFLRWQERS